MQNIKISEILDDLERGLSREDTSPDYNSELGSIRTKYNLTKKELKYLFGHEKLKNKRTKLPVMFNLVDDTVTDNERLQAHIIQATSLITSTPREVRHGVLDALRASSEDISEINRDILERENTSITTGENIEEIVQEISENRVVSESENISASSTFGDNW